MQSCLLPAGNKVQAESAERICQGAASGIAAPQVTLQLQPPLASEAPELRAP